ncbi:MAG: ROK family protein [Clostridia bacterium]|nr:ROK family protein [Clostridia bacterium]
MKYIGIDIGGTKCAVSLGEDDGRELKIIDKSKFPTAGKKPETVLDEFMLNLDLLLAKYDLKYSDFDGIGISCGGPLNSETGIIMSPPNLPGWDDVHAVEYFTEKTKLPCNLQNDANACAVAEWKYGAGKGTKNMIFMTFGTGLGAGLILNGKLYSGTSDMAGEVGHLRLSDYGPVGYGKIGSFEGFCSGGGIAQIGVLLAKEQESRGNVCELLKRAGSYDAINAKIIGDMADEGDELCIQAYRISGEMLGKGLSIVIDILNPERIVIGGVFAKSSHLLLPYAQKVIDEETLIYSGRVCEVVPCGLGDKVGDYAALSVASL